MSDTAVLPAVQSAAARLVDRDDLIDDESSEARGSVPNYFLDTQIFNKIGRNAIVEAQPSTIHFSGFEPHSCHVQKVRFANVSTDVTRFHILPPETAYFKLNYTKPQRLVPGFSIECELQFKPAEVRYYYDALRVHSEDSENNLIIPIHAYPILGESDFPQQIKFAAIPVGYRKTKVIPLRSRAPVEFEFEIKIVESNPVFSVEPLGGKIPANGEVDIVITFAPIDFVTAEMTLELLVSQFNFQPRRCHVMGNSAPGMERQIVLKAYGIEQIPDPGIMQQQQQQQQLPDPRSFSPLERARRNKRADSDHKYINSMAITHVNRNGYKIPIDLNSPHAVAQVLNQQRGKLNMRHLRNALLSTGSSDLQASRQMKETLFEQEVSKCVYEERQNQLRWQVKLGDLPPGQSESADILVHREMAWHIYKRKRGDPDPLEEQQRTETQVAMLRSRRQAGHQSEAKADFDLYKNDQWESRWTARFRFVQAAWKVIVRRRAEEKLSGLRQLVIDWGQGKYAAVTAADLEKKEEEDDDYSEQQQQQLKETQLSIDNVGTITFPTHQTGQQIKKMEEAAPPSFPSLPERVVARRCYDYEPLQVPLHYQLQHYERQDVHAMSKRHVPLLAARALRVGASDEIIDLPAASTTADDQVQELGEMEQESELANVPLLLRPPAALLQTPQYHPLHVFNPAPGLRTFDQPPRFLETDPESRLCPLPRYGEQQVFLDSRDVVRGVTTWKKFVSAGLAALGNTPTLTRVWVPRWSDPFATELAPAELPKFLDGLDPDDEQHVLDTEPVGEGRQEEEEEEEEVQLTPEMVYEEFLARPAQSEEEAEPAPAANSQKPEEFPYGQKMPDSNVPVSAEGLVPRWRRERELELFLTNRANRMGKRAAARRQQLNSLLLDQSLRLC